MPTKSKKTKQKSDINIMIRGIGGQGVKLAGTVIGQAAIYDKRHAVQSMKYGSAITGGETRSEIKVSTKKIIYPRVTDIDVYVALTLEDLENYFESRIYITDLAVAKNIPEAIKDKLLLAPIIETAEKVGSRRSANMVLIGLLAQLFNTGTEESTIKAIKKLTGSKFHKVNIDAFRKGFELDISKYNEDHVLDLITDCKIAC